MIGYERSSDSGHHESRIRSILASGNESRRRLSSSSYSPAAAELGLFEFPTKTGATTAFPAERGRVEHLDTIPGTPADMASLSRSPSPQPGGGWSTPGLTDGTESPKGNGKLSGLGTWSTKRSKSGQANAYSAPNKGGFIRRNLRQLSASLPKFQPPVGKAYSDKEKLGRGRWHERIKHVGIIILRIAWHFRLLLTILVAFVLSLVLFYKTREHSQNPSTSSANSISPPRYLPPHLLPRRRQQIRRHTRRQPRRRSNGMERSTRMGHRTRQRPQQTSLRQTLGLQSRDRRYGHQETLRP